MNNSQFSFVLLMVLCFAFSVQADSSTHQDKITQELTPIVRVAPTYPPTALIERQEGWVKVKMNINAQGSVDEVFVIEAQPPKVFDRAAVQAVLKFKFIPRHINGKPVPSEATQTIEFILPEEVIPFNWEQQLTHLLRDKIDALPAIETEVILSDTIKIESDIAPKKVSSFEFFFSDKPSELNPEPHFWQNPSSASNHIDNFEQQLAAAKQLVQKQNQQHPNIFKRFHRIYSAKNHPPTLLSGVNVSFPTESDIIRIHRYKLKINADGDVETWKYLDSQGSGDPAGQKWVDQLKFYPAIKNNKAVEDTIKLTFKTAKINQLTLASEMAFRNRQLALTIPWVQVATLIDTKGRVEDVKVLASSNSQFEQLAVMRLYNQRFKRSKHKRQMISVIEFEPQDK